jgi:hypothetical protein
MVKFKDISPKEIKNIAARITEKLKTELMNEDYGIDELDNYLYNEPCKIQDSLNGIRIIFTDEFTGNASGEYYSNTIRINSVSQDVMKVLDRKEGQLKIFEAYLASKIAHEYTHAMQSETDGKVAHNSSDEEYLSSDRELNALANEQIMIDSYRIELDLCPDRTCIGIDRYWNILKECK